MHQSYRSSAMLKTMAKGQLIGKYPTAALTFLLAVMISLITRSWISGLVDQRTVIGLFIFTAINFIATLFNGVINAGVSYMSLKICCNEPIRVSDTFYAFTYQPEKIIRVLFVSKGLVLLALLPFSLFQLLHAQSGQTFYLILTVAALVAGAAISCHISLMLSQTIFLFLDFNDRTPREIMQMSAALMNGHKGRLFYLWISFIPLLLLGLFTCCIGYIWIIPYLKVALANFYMDLTQNRPQ